MKTLLLTAATLMLGVHIAAAQTEAPAEGETPMASSCAEALPQIQALVDQAEQSGIDTETAKGYVAAAENAQAANDDDGCIRALQLAQSEVLSNADAQPDAAAQ